MAGANCQVIDELDMVKGMRDAPTTTVIMYTLGYPVERSQLDVDYATETYKELERLTKWL